jgi:hypothetical protein
MMNGIAILTVQSTGVRDGFTTLALHHDRVATINRPLRPLCMMVTSSSTPSPHAAGASSPSSSSSTTMLPVALEAIAASVYTTSDRVLSISGKDYAKMKVIHDDHAYARNGVAHVVLMGCIVGRYG